MAFDKEAVKQLESQLDAPTRQRVERSVDRIVAAKENGGKVAVVTGSGP